jgi:hypothetical protein
LNQSQPRPRPRSYTKKFTGCELGVDCGVWPHKAAALDSKTKKQIERRTPTSKMIAGFCGNGLLNFYVEDFFLKTRAIAELCPHLGSPWIGTGSLSDLQTLVAQASMNKRSWSTTLGLVFNSTVGWRSRGDRKRNALNEGSRLRLGEKVPAICKSCKTGTFPGAKDTAESKTGVSSKPRAAAAANRLS